MTRKTNTKTNTKANGRSRLIKALCAMTVCLMLALTMTACGGSGSSDSGDESIGSMTKITFCLDWTPNTNYTGIYVAQSLGFYEEAGLEVEVVQPPEDGSITMCAAGQAQMSGTAQDSLAKAFDTTDDMAVTAVAALLQHNTSGIMSRAGEGMDTPKGLEGKTYSTWQDPTEIAMIQNVMEKSGADFNKLTMIPNDITDEPAALKAKQTDAIWVYYGWGGINAEVEKVDCDFWFFKDFDEALDYYTPVIIANDQWLKDSPDTAKAFLEATAKGYEYAVKNPEEAADMLIAGDNTGSLAGCEDLVYKSQKWLNDQYIADAPQWGYIDEQRWNDFYKWLYDEGLTKTDLTGKGFTNEYLPAGK